MENPSGKVNNMEIISISMDKNTLKQLNRTQEKLGFKSRSKLVRAGIDSLMNEYSALESLRGRNDAVFTVIYQHRRKDGFGNIMSRFEDIITTEIHQHSNGNCLRILIVSGDAERIIELFRTIKSSKEINSVSCNIL